MSGVVSVGVALGATAIAATDVAAVGIAGIGLGTAFEIAGAVGATIGAVGALTHNKALMIAGAGIGIVGGVGALADGAGLFGAAAASGAAPVADATTGAVGAAAADPATAATSAAVGTGGGGTQISDIVDKVASGGTVGGVDAATDVTPTSPIDPQTGLPPQGEGGMPNSPAGPGGQFAGATPVPPNTADATATTSGTTPPNINGDPAVPSLGGSGSIPAPTSAPSSIGNSPRSDFTGGSSVWSKLMKFVDDHPGIALGGLSTAASFLSGAMNPKTPAEITALNAKAQLDQSNSNLNNQQAAILGRRLTNMGQSMPVASTGGPSPLLNRG